MHSKVIINATEQERQLIRNAEIFQLKRHITGEIIRVFSSLCEELKEAAYFRSFPFPEGVDSALPRISRGENFHGLPWIACDFPRAFSKTGVFAMRTYFWWGRSVLFYFHLSGSYLECYRNPFRKNSADFDPGKYRISMEGKEWEYDPDRIPSQPLSSIREEQLATASFIKIFSILPLEQLDELPDAFHHFHRDMTGLLKAE